MSFYRTLVAAVAALGVASAVFAADETTTSAAPSVETNSQTVVQTTSTTSETESKVDLNKASAQDLMKVKGLNRAKANAIVSYRKAHGDFKSVEDLKEVKGFKKMNEQTMKDIQNQLAV